MSSGMETGTVRPGCVLGLCFVTLLAACGGGGTPVTEPSPAAETAQTTSSTVLTYSGVVATYPIGTDRCITEGFLAEDEGGLWGGYRLYGEGTVISFVDGKTAIQCYGTKLTVGGTPVTLDGQTYVPGTKLTVDENLDWIEVSSWQ